MITCMLPVPLDTRPGAQWEVRADCVSPADALKWLEKHVWGVMQFNYDAEDRVAWRIRWAAWPGERAAGAGRTLDEALSRCFQMAFRNRTENRCGVRYATDEELSEAGF